ncbi:monovalent cation/H+ antiporter complex subunit F [Microbacterium sp. ZXX196]|uniref:monovalent cation/H+ antiporter complex subunit F n=1 Tax=Microbacterium sp. ZXX196 TaxID=2609291 RepID=UPI00132C060D|nr:sodium:proton antiporter [Microbacterium sp. ZXX196]
MTVETVLVAIIVGVFALAAVLTIVRIVRGPSILDRAIASDVLLTEVLCIMGVEAIVHQRTDTLPVMLAIAVTGALGTIAVARFVARRDATNEGA